VGLPKGVISFSDFFDPNQLGVQGIGSRVSMNGVRRGQDGVAVGGQAARPGRNRGANPGRHRVRRNRVKGGSG
jgi:hypothetical protein